MLVGQSYLMKPHYWLSVTQDIAALAPGTRGRSTVWDYCGGNMQHGHLFG